MLSKHSPACSNPRSQDFWGACSLFATFLCWFLCCTFACIHWPAHTKCHPGDPGISSGKVEKEGFPLFRPHVINPYVLTCPRNSGSGARGLFWSVILDTFVNQLTALVPKIEQIRYYGSPCLTAPKAVGNTEHRFNGLKPQYALQAIASAVAWA